MKQAALALVLVIVVLLLSDCKDNNEHVYDCGMAEWHPDIPSAVKEECRKIRSQRINKHT
jgi:hypothetical protein